MNILWPLCVLAFSLVFARPSAHAFSGDCSELPQQRKELSLEEVRWLTVAEQGTVEALRRLSSPTLNIHVTDEMGKTALHKASASNSLSVVRELLRLGLSASAQNIWGETPLMLAAGRGEASITKALIMARAPLNIQSCSGNALTYAIGAEDLTTVNLLLDSGANPHLSIRDNLSPLMISIERNHSEIFERLLLAAPDLNQMDVRGGSALTRAIQKKNLSFVEKLLNSGANVNLHLEQMPTPLALALGYSSIAITERLLNAWPDVVARFTWNGVEEFTTLMVAVERGQDMIHLLPTLLERGVKLEAHTPFTSKLPGYRALHIALRSGHADVVEELLRLGACPDALTRREESPLWLGVRQGELPVALIQKLIELAPQLINRVDIIELRSPLIWAAINGDLKTTQILLATGADPLHTDRAQHTAYYHAQVGGHQEVALELAKAMDKL